MILAGDYYRGVVSGRSRGLWPGLLRSGLRAVSVPYGWATYTRNQLYDLGWKKSRRAPVPVVSVGNLTLGGTGKTPCVEYIARFYVQHDRRVAILSRGFGSNTGRNDEAMVLEENLPDVPHLQGPDRVALAATAVEELQSDVLVLDDGFQHRRLARDLDVVLIDATEPWGHGYVFPRGLLREGRAGLGRADAVVLTRCDQVDEKERGRLREAVARWATGVPLAETRHQPLELVNSDRQSMPLERMQDGPVAAFCGIGNPEAFRRTLAGAGASICAFRSLADHHVYTRTDVEDLRAWTGQQAALGTLITTQKDLVKLRLTHIGDKELWALRIGLHFEAGRDMLDRKLLEVVSGEGGERRKAKGQTEAA